ncbi:MAG: hypothetical protein HS104_38705 [Polyangiaceae bacterium]|nr:hypothetical protein [Polyangiaceae bacterium]MBK8997956.1 hypothetical protein [Myxococcales bacterium]
MSRMKTLSALTLTLSFCLVAACGSDDSSSSSSGGSLVSFKGSACKKEGNSSALTAEEAYAGLQCVRWKSVDADTVKIDLLNFEGACGAEWKGQAKEVDGGLELRLANPGCLLAACGVCIYDWSFEVKAKGGADLPVNIVTDPCPGEQTPETLAATVPLGSAAEGELCRYADHGALGWQASSLGTCGKAYMPCRTGSDMCAGSGGEPECEAGLTCADGASAGEKICHATCTGDGDCAPTGTMKCDGGLCRPAKPW